MCLAVPVKIVKIIDPESGIIDSSGVWKEVNISLIEAPVEGDYVLVHAGFAIERLDPEDALETLDMFRELMSDED